MSNYGLGLGILVFPLFISPIDWVDINQHYTTGIPCNVRKQTYTIYPP